MKENFEFEKLPDEVLAEALRLMDAGSGAADILERFPSYGDELRALFAFLGELRDEGRAVRPDRQVLDLFLARLPDVGSVTTVRYNRYDGREDIGRASPVDPIRAMDWLNRMSKAYIAVIAVLVLIVAGGVTWYLQREEPGDAIVRDILDEFGEPLDDEDLALVDESSGAFEDEAAPEVTGESPVTPPPPASPPGGRTPPPPPPPAGAPPLDAALAVVGDEGDDAQPEDDGTLGDDSPDAYEDETAGEI